jgi:hypothetical protein
MFEASFNKNDRTFVVFNQYEIKRSKIRLSSYAFEQIADLKKSEAGYLKRRQLYKRDDLWNQAVAKVQIKRVNISEYPKSNCQH